MNRWYDDPDLSWISPGRYNVDDTTWDEDRDYAEEAQNRSLLQED